MRKDHPGKAYAYLDGQDARVFKLLKEKLGSEESVQNAIILEGVIRKLSREGRRVETKRIERMFPSLVGISYAKVQKIVTSMD